MYTVVASALTIIRKIQRMAKIVLPVSSTMTFATSNTDRHEHTTVLARIYM